MSQANSRASRQRRRVVARGENRGERAGGTTPAPRQPQETTGGHREKKAPHNRATEPLAAAAAVELARAAIAELGAGESGQHLGVSLQQNSAASGGGHVATHRFAAKVPGYQGWEWNVVLARAEGSSDVTLNEAVLLPAPSGEALQAPEWVPWSRRVRPGDLHAGDILPPEADDERLTADPAASATADIDPERTAAAQRRGHYLSPAGLQGALRRWRGGEFGPTSEWAQKATLYCATCAFFLPLAGEGARGYGACANEYAADGHIVAPGFGCGAHSETPQPAAATNAQATNSRGFFDDERPIF